MASLGRAWRRPGRIAKAVDRQRWRAAFHEHTTSYVVHKALSFTFSVHTHAPLSLALRSFGFLRSSNPTGLVPAFARPYGCTVSDCSRVACTPTPFPCPRPSLSLALRSFGFLRSPTPPGLVPAFARPYGYSVSDCSRVAYTPTPSPCSHSSLSCALRFLGFCSSTSKRLTTSSAESMYSNSCMMLNTVCEGP